MRTIVCPGARNGSIRSIPSPVSALTAITVIPGETPVIWRTREAGSSARSALFTTITGRAPEACAIARYRSILLAFRSGPAAVTRKTVSTLAAMTWSVPSRPAAPRVNTVLRGRMSTIVEIPASGFWSRTTKSPTAGNLPSFRRAPEIPALIEPPSIRTSQEVFCRQAILPGI